MATDMRVIVHRYFGKPKEMRDKSEFEEFIDQDFVMHYPGMGPIEGPEGFAQLIDVYYTAMPDMEITVDEMIVEGDSVAVRWHAEGTNTGDFMGISATGRHVRVSGMDILHVRDGKVIEDFSEFDQAGMMRQFGVTGVEQTAGVAA